MRLQWGAGICSSDQIRTTVGKPPFTDPGAGLLKRSREHFFSEETAAHRVHRIFWSPDPPKPWRRQQCFGNRVFSKFFEHYLKKSALCKASGLLFQPSARSEPPDSRGRLDLFSMPPFPSNLFGLDFVLKICSDLHKFAPISFPLIFSTNRS